MRRNGTKKAPFWQEQVWKTFACFRAVPNLSIDKTILADRMETLKNTRTKSSRRHKMFGKIMELGSLMKQAHEFGGRMHEMNEKLKDIRVEGNAAGGLVIVSVNGLQELISCKIDPSLFQQGDAELLEELIVNAVNDAVDESREQQAETMRSLTSNVDMSSLTGILDKLVQK